MVRSYSAQKAGLTRALKTRNPDTVLREVTRAVREWEATYWPDDWARWQRALDDTYPFGQAPDIDTLR